MFTPRDYFIDKFKRMSYQGYLYNPATEEYDYVSPVCKTKSEVVRLTFGAADALRQADAADTVADLTPFRNIAI